MQQTLAKHGSATLVDPTTTSIPGQNEPAIARTLSELGNLSGKIVLITGCTGGIGSATARLLAKRGCSIAVHYHANASKADELVKELQGLARGVRAQAFQADLSSYANVRALHAAVVSQLGEVDVLFNNSGVTGPMLGRNGNIEDLPLEAFEETWRTNTGSSFLLTQLCIPYMVRQQWGRIVFCSSVSANTGGVVGVHYASSKAALHGIMHWIAQRYAPENITCNAVAPALIMNTGMLPVPKAEYEALIPMGRLGLPEEIASIVDMLVDNGYMTNKIIVADGGWTGAGF